MSVKRNTQTFVFYNVFKGILWIHFCTVTNTILDICIYKEYDQPHDHALTISPSSLSLFPCWSRCVWCPTCVWPSFRCDHDRPWSHLQCIGVFIKALCGFLEHTFLILKICRCVDNCRDMWVWVMLLTQVSKYNQFFLWLSKGHLGQLVLKYFVSGTFERNN